jgi:hypothetical protein
MYFTHVRIQINAWIKILILLTSYVGILKKSMGTRNRVEGCCTGPPGYTAGRNWFLGIDCWASEKFKNSALDKYTTCICRPHTGPPTPDLDAD